MMRARALTPLPVGDLRPAGWLRKQVELQVDGMAGRLDELWPDIRDSAWIGGTGDGWERGPYWLDAVVPLCFLADDRGLRDKVDRWVDAILEAQDETGWIAPRAVDEARQHHGAQGHHDVWPRMVILKALLQYRAATGDERVLPAALHLCRRISEVLEEEPLREWGRARWADLVISVDELYEASGEVWLDDLADELHAQGLDWQSFAKDIPFKQKVSEDDLATFQGRADGVWLNDDFLSSHGVNVAMGLKALPVWWRHTDDDELQNDFMSMLQQLDEYHGQATGIFSSDEHLAGVMPSQGTETCAVVEMLFSLEVALEAWGPTEDVVERLERIAFNALPASARADENGHQYVQQVNQVVCHVTEDRIYTNNGPDANTFGLEPNFGCCTANRHQGWPKFAARLWMRSAEDGLVALSYAPCSIGTEVRGSQVTLTVEGDYPFDDDVTINLSTGESVTFPLDLRIPGWTTEATVSVDGGEAVRVAGGTTYRLERRWSGPHSISLQLPAAVTTAARRGGAITVRRGPILFALAVDEDWRRIGGEAPFEHWEVHPVSHWAYALCLDPTSPATHLKIDRSPLSDPPFSPQTAPIRLRGSALPIPDWQLEHGAASQPPESPVTADGSPEPVALLPYGAARLRVTEIPWCPPASTHRNDPNSTP